MTRATIVALLASAACSSTTTSGPNDASVTSDAAPSDAGDAGAGDAVATGAPCTFNRDCRATDRCECSESAGCACRPGARGTGRSGVNACTDGNVCASALCVEGAGGTFVCSGECVTAADCGALLPVCASIATLGRVCIRQSDGG